LGHKKDWEFSDVSVRTSVAAYFQNYEDIQNTVSFSEGGRLVTKTENAGKAEISGLEFELTVKPTDNLRFDASYSFIDAQFTKRESRIDPVTVVGPSDVIFVDSHGDDFTYIPKQSLTASTTYTLPLDANIGEVSLTAGVYWQDEMSTHPNRNEFDLYGWDAATLDTLTEFSTVDAYSVYNLRANWRAVMGSSFDVAAYVDNVSDEEYVLGGLNVVESGGYGAYHYGAPRTVGASVKYSF
jgi:iron complex outermembrane receptor protein